MKTILLATFALTTGLLALPAVASETNSAPASTEAKLELKATSPTEATNAPAATVAVEKTAPSGPDATMPPEVLTKAPPSKVRSVLALFNPFAPVEPEQKSTWRERTGWAGAADKSGLMTPEAVRHESEFGVVVAKW